VRVLRGDAVVATATPSADGSWSATVRPSSTGPYRATSGADSSETRRILVSGRHLRIRLTRRGVAVEARPSDPGARIVLQQRLRERFGWWTVARTRLDFLSEASFRLHRRAPVRAVLVARDGWTRLATSRVLHPRRS
jgi:hypothetical protein